MIIQRHRHRVDLHGAAVLRVRGASYHRIPRGQDGQLHQVSAGVPLISFFKITPDYTRHKPKL